MAGELDHLHQIEIGVHARDDQARLLQRVAVAVVDLEAVPVALVDQGRAIEPLRQRAALDAAGIGAEPHGAALFGHALLRVHQGDHQVGAVLVELEGIGLRESQHIARELDHRHLQTQTDAEERDGPGAGVPNGFDLPLGATDAEAARHQDPVDAVEQLLGAFSLDLA